MADVVADVVVVYEVVKVVVVVTEEVAEVVIEEVGDVVVVLVGVVRSAQRTKAPKQSFVFSR